MTVDGLKKFILSMGSSKNTNLMSWDKIWAMNRDVIDAARRATWRCSPRASCRSPSPARRRSRTSRRSRATRRTSRLGKKTRIFAPTVMLQADDAAGIARARR